MLLKRVALTGLALIIMIVTTAGVSAETNGVVPIGHWLYEAYAQLAGDGLVPGYPQDLIGQSRELTRFEMAYWLKGLLDPLLRGELPAGTASRHKAMLEKCIRELRRELIALGISAASLDEMCALWAQTPEAPSADPDEFAGLSQTGDYSHCGSLPEADSLGFILPASYGLSESLQLQRSFIVSDMPFLPMGFTATVSKWLSEESGDPGSHGLTGFERGIALVRNEATGEGEPQGEIVLDVQRHTGVLMAPFPSFADVQTFWKLSAGPDFASGFKPTGMILFGAPTSVSSASLGGRGSNEPAAPPTALFHTYSSSDLLTGTKGLDMQLEIGRVPVDSRVLRLPGLSGSYGQLGLHARYDYTNLGALAAAGSQMATVSLESRFVLGEYASVFGSYGYTAIRHSVAQEFNLGHSLTNAGVSVQIAPKLKLFAEYLVLAPTMPSQESQALLGLSYSDYGSLLFGYRLLHLGEAELIASFSLKF